MLTRIFLLLLLSVSSFAQGIRPMAHVVYVDNSPTGAEISPTQLTGIQSGIPDNTKIHFEAGQTYETGDIDLTSDVSVLPYRVGADPDFTGSREISSLTWTPIGGGVYTTPMVSEPKWTTIDGLCAKMAETARIPILSRGSNTTITISNALVSGYTNIVGSKLLAKETPFKVSRICEVTAYNSGTGEITVNQDIPQGSAGAPNVDLVLLNDTEYFSGDNEWVWRSGTLYVKAAASPSTMNIRVIENVFAIRSTGNLTVRDIEFQEYYTAAVWGAGVVDVENCYFHDGRDVAVFIQKAANGVNVSNNLIERWGNNGIFTRSVSNSTFNDNAITDTGMQPNYGWQTWVSENLASHLSQGNGLAIVQVVDPADLTANGTGTVYERNIINNSAYNGISQHTGTNPTIRYNHITNTLNRFIDGGAIYTFHYRQTNLPIENAEIAYNVIDNQKFTINTIGIYCDNRTRAANVHHNTVRNAYEGIRLNYDTEGHTISDNKIYNCIHGVTFLQFNLGGGFLYEDNINNTFSDNEIAVTGSEHYATFLWLNYSEPTWNPFSGTGGGDNNTYIKNTAPDANNINARNDNSVFTYYTLASFQSAYGIDASSIKLTRNPSLFINPTNTISNEDAQSEYQDFTDTPVTTYTIPSYYSRIINEINYSNSLVAASTQYFNAGTTSDIQFTHTDEYTVAVRFKIVNNPAAAIALLDNRDGSGRGWVLQVNTSGFLQFQAVNTVGTNRYQFIHNVDVADGNWHQFIVVKDATVTSSRFWLDGVERFNVSGGASNLTATTASTSDLLIGSTNSGAVTMDGLIDDVFIWTGDKSSKIVQIYNGGRSIDYRLNMPDDLPLHGWRMGQTGGLIDGYEDIGTSATSLDLTPVNGSTATTDSP